MSDIDWMTNATYYDPAADRSCVTTLDKIAQDFGDLTPNQAVRAHATAHAPIDLGDGAGLRSDLTDTDLARLCHRYDRHVKGLSD